MRDINASGVVRTDTKIAPARMAAISHLARFGRSRIVDMKDHYGRPLDRSILRSLAGYGIVFEFGDTGEWALTELGKFLDSRLEALASSGALRDNSIYYDPGEAQCPTNK